MSIKADSPEVVVLLNALSYVRGNIDGLNELEKSFGKQPTTFEQFEAAVLAFTNDIIEMDGSRRGTLDHVEVLNSCGYEVIPEPIVSPDTGT